MNENQKYFIHLLSSHLNNSPPLPNTSADWMGVFKLGELHNVTAMLTLAIKQLPANNRPPKQIMSYYNQALGMTLQNFDTKKKAIAKLVELLDENKIRHLFLKGAAIRQYYPVGDVRTSGDTDLVVDAENLNRAADILAENGFSLKQRTNVQNVLVYNGEEFEIENYIDCVNSRCEEYFSITFDDEKCYKFGDYSYFLKPTEHLIYVISHLLRHLTEGGVGIRQLMDVDVLIRCGEIDLKHLLDTTENLGIGKSTKALLAISKQYFDTPVDLDYVINDNLLGQLEKVIFEGGVFGFAISNPGTARLVESYSLSKKKGFTASIKAFIKMLFPGKDYFYNYYKYSEKHHILLPFAFIHRLFDAVFKRGKQNRESVKTVFGDKGTALMISDIINELEIEKDL